MGCRARARIAVQGIVPSGGALSTVMVSLSLKIKLDSSTKTIPRDIFAAFVDLDLLDVALREIRCHRASESDPLDPYLSLELKKSSRQTRDAPKCTE